MVEATDDGPATAAAEMVVLEAKLHPPASHPEHVARPGLLQRLDEAAIRPLTLMNAPAGFGKSTLLAAWCAQATSQRRYAWLSLDEGDNDPVVFWSYVLHALRRLEPERFVEELRVLAVPGVSLTRGLLPRLLNDLWMLDQPLVLVLDDYHQVTEPACHESLRFFLRRLPPTLRLLLATRADPPLGLGILRARGELAELRAAELRFTDEEAATFLCDRLGLQLTTVDVARLAERTEGWPAGLYLGALSLRGRPDTQAFIADFAGSHRHIVDYLGGEVLDRLTAEERTFFVQTSIPESFTAALCDALTGGGNAAARLGELERTNLFLIPLDERRTWYRYHHLFQELLQVELTCTAPELVPELHRRAAAWYRRAGDPVAAMRHALAEPNYALAAEVFIENAQPFQATGRFATVESWMDQLPEAAVRANPPLALAVAWIAAIAYRPKPEVDRWLAAAAASDQPGPFLVGSHTMRSAVALVRAIFLFDDIGGAVVAAEEAVRVETDPERHSYLLARGSLGQALYFAGRPAEARPLLEAAVTAPLADRQASSVTRFLAFLAMVNLELGEIGRAEEMARRSTDLRERSGLTEHPSHWTSSLALAMVLCRRGLFVEAEAVLTEGVEPHLPMIRDWRIPYAHALLVLAPVRFARGHPQAARALLEEAREAIATCSDPGMLPTLLAATERSLGRLPRRATGLRQDLTESELRILRLLASDLSQREIGRELYVSMNTIKTHLRSIYTKLDVASRRDAVTRARAIGLIA